MSLYQVVESVEGQAVYSSNAVAVGVEKGCGSLGIEAPKDRAIGMAAQQPHRCDNLRRRSKAKLASDLQAATNKCSASYLGIVIKG